MEPGAIDVLTHGATVSPRSTAFLASIAAAIITDGLDVLVQEVIEAIDTMPWSISNDAPSAVVTVTGVDGRPRPSPSSAGRVPPFRPSGLPCGVGSLAVQLARRAGATVIGLAGATNRQWLSDHGVIPVRYGEGVGERIREASHGKVDAFIDTFGGGYVDLAIQLGVPKDRIDTIIDFAAIEKYGVKSEGNAAGATADVMAELAKFVADGELEVPIAKVYPLDQVREAYQELEKRHTRGKIVLMP